MGELALVPAWFWVALGTILALAGLVVGVWKSRGHAYRPVRRLRARDVVALTEAEGRDFYGSMTLPPAGPHSCCCHGGFSGEHDCCLHPHPQVPLSPAGYLRGLDRVLASTTTTTNLARDPDDPYDPEEDEPFRWLPAEIAHGEPTAAEVAASRAAHGYIPELAPETGAPELFACIYCEQDTPNGEPCPVCGWDRCAVCLRCIDQAAHDIEQGNDQPDPYLDALTAQYGSEFDDPGPGDPPWALVPPGPDQGPWECPRCHSLFERPGFDHEPCWLPSRLADTGDIAAAHLTHPGPDTERLDWLDQQLAAHLEWARGMRGQVTGWGLEAAA